MQLNKFNELNTKENLQKTIIYDILPLEDDDDCGTGVLFEQTFSWFYTRMYIVQICALTLLVRHPNITPKFALKCGLAVNKQ